MTIPRGFLKSCKIEKEIDDSGDPSWWAVLPVGWSVDGCQIVHEVKKSDLVRRIKTEAVQIEPC
jgi:hypothetical protein